MLTPRDIHQAEFKKVWKGYSPEEVDAFLRRVVLEYERVYKENQRLVEENARLEERVREYSSSETQITQMVEMAKESSAATRSAAEKEAATIVGKACMEADQVRQRAAAEVAAHRRQVEMIVQEIARYRAQVQESVDRFAAYLAEIEEPALPALDIALRESAATDGEEADGGEAQG